MLAVAGGDENLECIKVLLAHGADPNCKDDNKNTLLHIAAKYRRNKILEYLVENNAIILYSGKNMETALDICKRNRNKTGVELL